MGQTTGALMRAAQEFLSHLLQQRGQPCKKACLHWLVDSSGYEGTLNFNRVESRDIQKASWAQPCPDPLCLPSPLPTQPRQIRQSCRVYSRQRWHQCLLLASLCSPWVINMNHNDPEEEADRDTLLQHHCAKSRDR